MLAAETSTRAPAKIPGRGTSGHPAGQRRFSEWGNFARRNGFVCENLSRMAQIYRKLDVIGVRAVATSAVRDASIRKSFFEGLLSPWMLRWRSSPVKKRPG